MMKRRVFGMLLSLCLVLALIPAAAFAEDAVQTISLTAPYTTTVEQGGSAKPGKTVFKLKLMDNMGESMTFEDGIISGLTVTTDGVGDYDGNLIFTVASGDLFKLEDGIFVQQVDEGKDGWAYDDTVWYVKASLVAARAAQGDAEGLPIVVLISPTNYEDTGDGNRYYIPTEEWEGKMTFTNTYTKSTTETPVPSESAKPSVSPEPTNPGKATPAPDVTDLPKTGDSSNLTGWLALLAVSAAAVAGVFAYSRRRNSARE